MAKIVNRFAEHLSIKERNDGRKYTNRDIAEITGLNKNTVGQYIRNDMVRPHMDQVQKLCEFLGISPGEFWTWANSSVESEDDDSKQLEALLPASA